jgi:hypothetical protein
MRRYVDMPILPLVGAAMIVAGKIILSLAN